MSKKILVTGGTGYIGSHTTVELINAGYEVEILDNLFNSKIEVLDKIKEITGTKPKFYQVDMLDYAAMHKVFEDTKYDAVMHFAGLKAVGESVEKPLEYYENNVGGTVNLLKCMQDTGVKQIIFSYVCVADPEFEVALLRYFNPIGAHPSGLLGEDPNGRPNNLMPIIMRVSDGRIKDLAVYGDDYPTEDGTCRRDYIHVVDLAKGHMAMLDHMQKGVSIYNLGSGVPTSVKQMIAAFEKASGKPLPHHIDERRAGDLPEFWANPAKAKAELGWQTELTIDDAMKDTLNFIEKSK